ncbi:hypothetical protein [Flavobacterium ajazii]|uniref:hypothetical protein n=1 Tax=Flavobacterium ajazii TaxID=2692318 RepID=UPI0013D8ABB1|nr:hypothetical protein [Flavobacterium ajazii]
MEKTTPIEDPVIIYPPGTDITPVAGANSIGNVTFQETKSVEILAPYVEAYYSARENTLTMNAIIYVAAEVIKNEVLDYNIIQNTYIDIEGQPQLQFFIVYNQPEELSGDLFIYEVIFQADADIFIGGLSKLTSIQTFLWDSDPVTSRGTVTIVQPTN